MQVLLIVLSIVSVVSSFIAKPSTVYRQPTRVYENFGFDFAEDSYANTPDLIQGEARYKQWVQKVNDNSFLNRRYNAIRRVRELNLLQATVDNGILSKLEKNGIDLVTIEKLLPLIEDLGLLGIAANNQQLLINGLAFFVVEGAPFLLPVLAGALEVGPLAFFGTSAALGAAEYYLIAEKVKLPLVGLEAGTYIGLLLVPLATLAGGLGVALAGNKFLTEQE
eukprot:CAMPEP_0194135654 /NCGR_PEP_ID=MMETSP0152-20130528/5754_1 /TAXON_ID=1049557 /ORGANISM="Thalassiothrix antarctica, Strain L6-D1" /LENGTH=221 /DNA_ID=CAMNT_0038831993 /DNA_START=54 /DNA_END=719 /DNA_ORIENTATION=-